MATQEIESGVGTPPGDRLLYDSTPPMFRNHPVGFVLTLLLVPVFGIGLIVFLVWYLSCRSHRLQVTREEIYYERGLLSKYHTEFDVSDVRTVRVYQSFFQRLFGTGDVEVFTAGDQPEIALKGMPEPERLRDLLN